MYNNIADNMNYRSVLYFVYNICRY